MMNVSPQQVNKWVKGKENFTLETLSRIEEALEIDLLAIDTRDKTNPGNNEQGISVFHVVSETDHKSIIYNSVKGYIESKKPGNRSNMHFFNFRNTAEYFQSFSNKEFRIGKFEDIVVGEEVSDNLTLFEVKKDASKVIELNPENNYKKKINLEDLLVAEPDEEYY